ncbi:hypothetical protein [Catenuloplanes japonicus]|uniref:hypothetical protein n=1 Tax=Catenuloplanes japonicus TaxID=33876 RepID=UPI000526A476|nr:hypothetical protein [Catenuloplanes japonicus]
MGLQDDQRVTATEDGRYLFEQDNADGTRTCGVLQRSGFPDGTWTSTWFAEAAGGDRVLIEAGSGIFPTAGEAYEQRPVAAR